MPRAATSDRTKAFSDLLLKIARTGTTARSEADLTRMLAGAFEDLGLVTVVDTTQEGPSKKRPDILCYVHQSDADHVLAADIVAEAKPPDFGHPDAIGRMLAYDLWEAKTLPYILANLTRIQYFLLTTFNAYACLPVTTELRRAFADIDPEDLSSHKPLQDRVFSCIELVAITPESASGQLTAWRHWIAQHFSPDRLTPPVYSTIANTLAITSQRSLDNFAARLAGLVAGDQAGIGPQSIPADLFSAIRARLPESPSALDPDTYRDLQLFVMSRNPATDPTTVATVIADDFLAWLDEFVASSIHSLVSRLFLLKLIEDGYCVGTAQPLLEEKLWLFHTTRFDGVPVDSLPSEIMARIHALRETANPLIRQFSVFGAFFDWIERHVSPHLFGALFELFVVTDFAKVEGDLLGRFFEVYAQRINRSRRKALGQYYTPRSIIAFMWSRAWPEVLRRARPEDVTVLDPAMGSGTFLKEGARWMAGPFPFWEHMVGFDISPQVLGIAQANVYMAILAQVAQERALGVTTLRLFTTDALDPRNGRYLKALVPLFPDAGRREFIERSIEVSSRIKREEQFCLVIGNPPYRNNSAVTLGKMAERFPRLLRSSAAAAAAQERNIRDDYAWFFAAADLYAGNGGLISFITSDSYARKPSYSLLRRDLLRHYRILWMVRLGQRVFQDVSDRIGFVIICAAKRESPLAQVSTTETIPVVDLRPMVKATPTDLLASENDPRLLLLDAVAAGRAELPDAQEHVPVEQTGFVLFPSGADVLSRIAERSAPIGFEEGTGIFRSKWPGIITAFDSLLKDEDEDALARRMASLFALARRYRSVRELERALGPWAVEHDIPEDQRARLLHVAQSMGTQGVAFDPNNIKHTFSGSMPNEARWYPPPQYRHWIYYEPRIKIPRNVNPGKSTGWGWMQQWRHPESHAIAPKLVYTTSANPRSAYKAFVLDETYYVKLHGGTSQQFNYTGLTDPTVPGTIGGEHNNLAPQGMALDRLLLREGAGSDGLLHYIAAIYNSRLAQEFIESEPGQQLPIHLPDTDSATLAAEICGIARRQRDLYRLLYDGPPEGGECAGADIRRLAGDDVLAEIGTSWKSGSSRYAAGQRALLPMNFRERGAELAEEQQLSIDDRVESLISGTLKK